MKGRRGGREGGRGREGGGGGGERERERERDEISQYTVLHSNSSLAVS